MVRLGAFAILAAGIFAACGKGTPLTSGTATPPPAYVPSVTSQYPIPTKSSRPMGIAVGSDFNIWFTEYASSKVGILTTAGTVATPEPVTPTANAGPNGIASGPNSLLWFTETKVGKIGQISLTTPPTFTEFVLPNAAARPAGIALGSDGNMWVTDPGTNSIWKVSKSGVVGSPCALPAKAAPLGITNGPDGALWFTEPGINRIGRLPVTTTGACGTLTQYRIPTKNAGVTGIAAGSDNALWFTEKTAKKLGRISITGHVTNQYSLAPAVSPNALLQGVDGNFYFTDTAGNHIGQFVVGTAKVTLFSIPTANSQPTAIVLGPDNQIYFTETAANNIGQFKYFCC